MKAIITVLGHDQVGFIGKFCSYLSEQGINILDISQTIIQGYFNMMMIVDLSTGKDIKFEALGEGLDELGRGIGVSVRLQHEDIFNTMHRI